MELVKGRRTEHIEDEGQLMVAAVRDYSRRASLLTH